MLPFGRTGSIDFLVAPQGPSAQLESAKLLLSGCELGRGRWKQIKDRLFAIYEFCSLLIFSRNLFPQFVLRVFDFFLTGSRGLLQAARRFLCSDGVWPAASLFETKI